jgi:hypothetical protein
MTEEADNSAPNWSIWKHLPRLKLYECVALSLNIDPLAAPSSTSVDDGETGSAGHATLP